MSLTLSLTQANPFEHRYSQSNSLSSVDTIRRRPCRHSSLLVSSPIQNENTPPPRQARSSTNLAAKVDHVPVRFVDGKHLRHAVSSGPLRQKRTEDLLQVPRPNDRPTASTDSFCTVPLEDPAESPSLFDGFSGIAELEAEDPLLPWYDSERPSIEPQPAFDPAPFRRWLSKLRRKKGLDKSGTSQSSGVLSAVRTATMTAAESSVAAPKSWLEDRLGHLRGSGFRSNRGSSESNMGTGLLRTALDESAYLRSIQRRKILEELITSEESYLGDLKVLTNVYFTLLASVCALTTHAKALVRENLTALLQLHEDILGDLYAVIPHAEYNHGHAKEAPAYHPKGHIRWHSADSGISRVRETKLIRRLRHSVDLVRPQRVPVGTTASAKTVLDVARIFGNYLPRFFAYEEYGAKYEMMVRDLAATYKTTGSNDAYERGIEVLSRTLESINTRDENGKKGLSFADLVIKPIQRVCRYPLLFADLLKQTPTADDPEVHAELEKILYRLKESANEINRSADDPSTRHMIERTWQLQDKLAFSDQGSPHLQAKMLGHVLLCGVLFVSYQSRTGIKGQYMLCALFKSCLVIATARKSLTLFDVVASIPMLNTSIEDADNGKGLQCHTASFTWKLVFQSNYRLYELMLSACSPIEEEQWQKKLRERSALEEFDASPETTGAQGICASLSLDLKSLATLYGQPNTVARRISIHRAATVAAKSQMKQVIIKHTESAEHAAYASSSSSLPLSRSKSSASAGHLATLAPRRSERMQLESALADVWTIDVLPYPGMKSENPLRASANHVIRKLSMASITSSFSRRSSTFVSTSRPQRPDSRSRPRTPLEFALDLGRGKGLEGPSKIAPPQHKVQPAHKQPVKTVLQPSATVNFHKNPDKFLPPDFELKDPRRTKPPRQKLAIRTTSEDVIDMPQVERRRPMHRLQRSLSAKIPTVKGAAERLRPASPSSPRRRASMVRQRSKEVLGRTTEQGLEDRTFQQKVRNLFA